MKLNKFTLSADEVGIAHNDQLYNLGSGYILVGLEYDVINQELNLKWIKGFGDGSDGQPDELVIEFTDVNFFKARERDVSKPYPRDEFVTAMGFSANTKIAEFDGDYQSMLDEEHQHINFEFGSGFAIKFSAATATLKTKSNL